jgi:hypothetical protein
MCVEPNNTIDHREPSGCLLWHVFIHAFMFNIDIGYSFHLAEISCIPRALFDLFRFIILKVFVICCGFRHCSLSITHYRNLYTFPDQYHCILPCNNTEKFTNIYTSQLRSNNINIVGKSLCLERKRQAHMPNQNQIQVGYLLHAHYNIII